MMLFSCLNRIQFRTAAILPLFLACVCASGVLAEETEVPTVTGESEQAGNSDTATDVRQASSRMPPREYYSVILNRKPFGDSADIKPAAPVDQQAEQAAAEQAKEEQNLARQIDMVAINCSPTGKTLVGLVDKGEKPPRNYCLAAGESAGGFTITEANFAEETATIERNGVSITLKLGKGVVQKTEDGNPAAASKVPSSKPTVSAPAPVSPAVQQPQQESNPVPGIQRRPGIRRMGEHGTGGYLNRLRERRANEAAATQEEIAKLRKEIEDAAKTSKEEATKRERSINLELISRGQQPLSPIELTPEEDAELVRKGVLAPEGKQ